LTNPTARTKSKGTTVGEKTWGRENQVENSTSPETPPRAERGNRTGEPQKENHKRCRPQTGGVLEKKTPEEGKTTLRLHRKGVFLLANRLSGRLARRGREDRGEGELQRREKKRRKSSARFGRTRSSFSKERREHGVGGGSSAQTALWRRLNPSFFS